MSKSTKAPKRCPACASTAGCDCVILPEEFRRIGFSGLFHLPTTLDTEAVAAFKDRVPCLVHGDRWALASVDEQAGTGVLVRKDAGAITEAFVRGFA